MKERIQQLAKENFEYIQSVRRYLHQYPELSFEEVKTSKYLVKQLDALGLSYQKGIVKTGIVVIIEGKKPHKKIIGLRGDIDALPILEKNDVTYTSKNKGVMHACGHDVHTSCLLGALKILEATKEEWEGTVKCIFQPGEEKNPGGASLMIKEGVLENPKIEAIIGQHVFPDLPVGKIGFRAGPYMASSNEIHITITGQGGHGAIPHDCIDPILIASHCIVALQQVVSRTMNPTIPAVLTIGKIASTGGSTNIIPNEVKILGTFRTMNEEFRAKAILKIKQIVEGTVTAMGGTCECIVQAGYPALENNPYLTNATKEFAVEYMGSENVVDLPLRMTSEDFAYFSQEIPGCFYRLGTANAAKGINSGLHTSTFDIDEKSLEIGMGLMAWLAIKTLSA